MAERPCRVLILDHDPEVLTHLQCVLEDGGVDTTITWDDAEACQLAQSTMFDLILLGDHPPEAAETILCALKAAPRRCLLLAASEQPEFLPGFDVVGVVPKADPYRVLRAVQEHCQLKQINAKSVTAA